LATGPVANCVGICWTFNVTLFGSGGRWRQETPSKGDVGYVPQGFGHPIENVGGEKNT
jgi:oxalate decarboxylase/phosphoglucose isomerase-like protein (cupin superfamily)